ncbi:MAG: transketolase family protein [Clostridiales bacterium]|jgi:transketolase|nr:transketolase family protein [Clostridiales bacterium]
MSKRATREGYGDALLEIGDDKKIVVLDSDLSNSTRTCVFKKKYPLRFFNCGIAEGNMISTAAGLSSAGKVVFASSFAMFAAGRAFEQIRNSVAHPNLNVKICASHAGISVGEDGGSHQCNEDIGIMRTIPNMTIVSPSDYYEAKFLIKSSAYIDGPFYIRLGRLAVDNIFNDSYNFNLGKGILLEDGKDVTIIATGLTVFFALEARKILRQDGISAKVINIHTIKPIDKEIIIKSSEETGAVVTVEEHNIIGGLGSAVSEILCEENPILMKRIGIQDLFGISGKPTELFKIYEINADSIVKYTKILLKINLNVFNKLEDFP